MCNIAQAGKAGAGAVSAGRAMRKPENRVGKLNAELRSFPPCHATTADGCVVKHKIECIGNSDVTFHIKAGAPVRQVADRTIDRRPAVLEGDACSLKNAAALRTRRRDSFRSSCFGLSICSIFRLRSLPGGLIVVACVVRFKSRSFADSLAPNVPREPHAKVTR